VAGRTPVEATHAFIEPLRRALACVWVGHISTTGYDKRPEPHSLTLNRGESVPLKCTDGSSLGFRVTMKFEHAEAEGDHGPWTVRTIEYIYVFEGADGEEFLSYHWHPSVEGIPYPHLHVERAGNDSPPLTRRTHVPTGRIAIEQVLRLAITQFGVQPLREDWAETLAQAHGGYEEFQTW